MQTIQLTRNRCPEYLRKTENLTAKRPDFEKWAIDLNSHFSKEDIKMANWYMEKVNMTNHQGKANQNHMRYQLTLVRAANTKKTEDSQCW